MKVGRQRKARGGREVAGGRWRAGGGGRRAGIIHTACAPRRTCRSARSTIGPPGWVPLCCLSTSCSRSRATCKAGAVWPLTRRLQACRRRRAAAAPIGMRRAEALSSVRRAAAPFGVRRAATPVSARRAAALAGGRRAEAVGRAKPGLFSRSTVAVLERGTAAAGPEGAGARRSAAAEAIDVARGL